MFKNSRALYCMLSLPLLFTKAKMELLTIYSILLFYFFLPFPVKQKEPPNLQKLNCKKNTLLLLLNFFGRLIFISRCLSSPLLSIARVAFLLFLLQLSLSISSYFHFLLFDSSFLEFKLYKGLWIQANMDGGAAYNPRTVEEVFRDFKGRRAGMIRALTTDVEEFYQQCDPEKENLCLYGFPNEQWEVNLPAEEVPPELPEPALGINFARDGMQEKDWLSLVAVHSDAWLLAVAFYFGARFGFDKSDRKRLFTMINDMPTIFEVVTGGVKKQGKDKSLVSNNSSNKSKTGSKGRGSEASKLSKGLAKEEDEGLLDEEEEEEHGETLCGACGENYASDEFWICCDLCEKWFHGKCVKITPARAEHIKQYKCPSCSNKRARP